MSPDTFICMKRCGGNSRKDCDKRCKEEIYYVLDELDKSNESKFFNASEVINDISNEFQINLNDFKLE